MSTKITERGGTRIVLPEAKGDKYKVRLMGWEPGAEVVEGSSADYPVSWIKRDFAEAFPKGTRMRANHDGLCESGGDIRRIMAKTVDAPWAEADGMYAHMVVPNAEHADFVANFADVIGLSISAGCELEYEAATDEDGEPVLDHEDQPVMVPKKSERGAYIVKRFMSAEESPYNSVDFVEAPGADGRIVARALESAREVVEGFAIREAATFAKGTRKSATEDSEASPSRSNKEEDMTPEERAALLREAAQAGAAAALEQFQRPSTESEQPTLATMSEAVITAGLTEAGRSEVYARVGRGETLESAIAAETTREANIEAEVERRVAERTAAAAATERDVLDFGFTSDEGDKSLALSKPGKSSALSESELAEFDAITAGGDQ